MTNEDTEAGCGTNQSDLSSSEVTGPASDGTRSAKSSPKKRQSPVAKTSSPYAPLSFFSAALRGPHVSPPRESEPPRFCERKYWPSVGLCIKQPYKQRIQRVRTTS